MIRLAPATRKGVSLALAGQCRSGEMCDYSLHTVKSRPAKVGDTLTSRDFGTGTRGFAASEDVSVAVCVLPGTELSFADDVRCISWWPWRRHGNRPQDRNLPAGQPRRSEAPSRCAGIPRRPDRSAQHPNPGSARNSSSVACCCCRDESAPACGPRFLTAKLAGLGRAAVIETPRAAALLYVSSISPPSAARCHS